MVAARERIGLRARVSSVNCELDFRLIGANAYRGSVVETSRAHEDAADRIVIEIEAERNSLPISRLPPRRGSREALELHEAVASAAENYRTARIFRMVEGDHWGAARIARRAKALFRLNDFVPDTAEERRLFESFGETPITVAIRQLAGEARTVNGNGKHDGLALTLRVAGSSAFEAVAQDTNYGLYGGN